MKNIFIIIGISLIACQKQPNARNIILPGIFTDQMVLQQQQQNLIWGKASPGSLLKIEFAGTEILVDVEKDGEWKANLPALPAGESPELKIIGIDTLEIKDILIGEVWLASGQSNMGYKMGSLKEHYKAEIENANNDQIRFLTVDKINKYTEQEEIRTSGWKVTNSENILDFSAVGYFFAKYLQENRNVPVGIINSSYGGTAIERWISRDTLESFPKYKEQFLYLDTLDETPEKIEAAKKEWILAIKEKYSFDGIKMDEWKIINAPEWLEKNAYPETDGFFWMKKKFDLPGNISSDSITLHLGPIDDLDFTFFNDTYIGNDGPWDKYRKYTIPRSLIHEGNNEIVIGVMDFASGGGFHGDPDQLKLVAGDKTVSLAGEWKVYHVADKEEITPVPVSLKKNSPAGLYNAMIAPVIQYGTRGVIWYQGEANVERAAEYTELFPALIQNWRDKSGNEELPFLFVQLANYKARVDWPMESTWAELREAQRKSLKVKNTGMAVAIDIGEAKDIHPRNKKEVGRRLSLAARKIAYGEDVVHSGPTLENATVDENEVVLEFSNATSGLSTTGNEPVKGFTIAGNDGTYHFADEMKIDGNQVIISSEEVDKPAFVRYGWADNPECNLYNEEGLPASPFQVGL
jgi:sialate O-acetylesterase